jgi:uncharacterized protein (UPF0212 family)
LLRQIQVIHYYCPGCDKKIEARFEVAKLKVFEGDKLHHCPKSESVNGLKSYKCECGVTTTINITSYIEYEVEKHENDSKRKCPHCGEQWDARAERYPKK